VRVGRVSLRVVVVVVVVVVVSLRALRSYHTRLRVPCVTHTLICELGIFLFFKKNKKTGGAVCVCVC